MELAKEWRTDKILRQLEALLIVADREHALVISGTGDVIEPEEGVAAIGSGGPYAQAAALALQTRAAPDGAPGRRRGPRRSRADLHLHKRADGCGGAVNRIEAPSLCNGRSRWGRVGPKSHSGKPNLLPPPAPPYKGGERQMPPTRTGSDMEDCSWSPLKPRQIVEELDRYIVGQAKAKRAVAVALRTRWRRQRLDPDLRDEVMPKNILMIGPTGVGKTEIARRLARLADAPFIKVEASKFTEVGYVGRDVESIIRDLTDMSVKMVKEEQAAQVREGRGLSRRTRARSPPPAPSSGRGAPRGHLEVIQGGPIHDGTREKLRAQLREGKLNDRTIETDVRERAIPWASSPPGDGGHGDQYQGDAGAVLPGQGEEAPDEGPRRAPRPWPRKRPTSWWTWTLSRARPSPRGAERDRLPRRDRQDRRTGAPGGPTSLGRASSATSSPLSRERRSIRSTAWSDRPRPLHRRGGFPRLKPSDLIPELQGRFPIRVELRAAREGRVRPHPDGAAERAHSAVPGAPSRRRASTSSSRRRRSRRSPPWPSG